MFGAMKNSENAAKNIWRLCEGRADKNTVKDQLIRLELAEGLLMLDFLFTPSRDIADRSTGFDSSVVSSTR